MSDADFETLVGRIASADLAARWRMIRAGNFPEAQLEDSRAKIGLAVERLEKRIDGDWIPGAFTIADLDLCPPRRHGRSCPRHSRMRRRPGLARPDEEARFGAEGAGALPHQRPAPGLGARTEINRWVSACVPLTISTAAPRSILHGSRCATPTAADLRRSAGADQADRRRDGRCRLPGPGARRALLDQQCRRADRPARPVARQCEMDPGQHPQRDRRQCRLSDLCPLRLAVLPQQHGRRRRRTEGARADAQKNFVCLDKAHDGDPSLEEFIAGADPERWQDPSDPFCNRDEIVGIFRPAAPPARPRGSTSPISAGER